MPQIVEMIRCGSCNRVRVYDVDTDTVEGYFEGPYALAKLDGWRWDRDGRRNLCPGCVSGLAPALAGSPGFALVEVLLFLALAAALVAVSCYWADEGPSAETLAAAPVAWGRPIGRAWASAPRPGEPGPPAGAFVLERDPKLDRSPPWAGRLQVGDAVEIDGRPWRVVGPAAQADPTGPASGIGPDRVWVQGPKPAVGPDGPYLVKLRSPAPPAKVGDL